MAGSGRMGAVDMNSSTGVAREWFAVTGSQDSRRSSVLRDDLSRYLRWPRVSVLELGPSPSAPAGARRHVTSVLAGWGMRRDLVSDAELIASELAANALRATLALDAPQPIGLRLLGNQQRLVIEMWDCGPGSPFRRTVVDDDAESGRGLQIVESLANRWGCRHASVHVKAVWAELLLQ